MYLPNTGIQDFNLKFPNQGLDTPSFLAIICNILIFPSVLELSVFLSMSGAYDSTWHTELLYKLVNIQISPDTIKIIKPYLSERLFRMSVEGARSNRRPTLAGIPQGSRLSHPCVQRVYQTSNDIRCGMMGLHLEIRPAPISGYTKKNCWLSVKLFHGR